MLFNSGSMKEALGKVRAFTADMMGTEIYKPLAKIKELKTVENYSTNIFVLTDGNVSSPESVI